MPWQSSSYWWKHRNTRTMIDLFSFIFQQKRFYTKRIKIISSPYINVYKMISLSSLCVQALGSHPGVICPVLVFHQANEQLIPSHIINIHSKRNTHFIGSILFCSLVNNLQRLHTYFDESREYHKTFSREFRGPETLRWHFNITWTRQDLWETIFVLIQKYSELSWLSPLAAEQDLEYY